MERIDKKLKKLRETIIQLVREKRQIINELEHVKNNCADYCYFTFNEERYLKIKDAARFLGKKISTLHYYSTRGILPKYKPQGGQLYFKVNDLEEFIEKSKIKGFQEILEEATSHASRKYI